MLLRVYLVVYITLQVLEYEQLAGRKSSQITWLKFSLVARQVVHKHTKSVSHASHWLFGQ